MPFSPVFVPPTLRRAMVGLGQAVAPTSIVDMIARIVRKEERASAVSLAFAGLHVGSIVGLLAAPILIGAAGWRALFVTFGAAGEWAGLAPGAADPWYPGHGSRVERQEAVAYAAHLCCVVQG